MIPIIVAIFLALSAVGGGVVVASHDAPASSPLHVVAVKTSGVFNTVQLPATQTATDEDENATPTVSPTPEVTVTETVSPTPEATATEAEDAADDGGSQSNKDRVAATPLPTQVATAIATVEADIQSLAHDPNTRSQDWQGLQAKLDAATRAEERGDGQAAANILNAFAHDLNAMESSNRITQDDYNALYTQYTGLATQLNAMPVPSVTPHSTSSVNETTTSTSEKHQKGSNSGADDQVTATSTPEASPSNTAGSNGHAKTTGSNGSAGPARPAGHRRGD